MPSEHPAITRFRDEHARRGGTGEIVILPESVHTAALAAEALGCEVGAIANSLVFDDHGTPVLILTSGAHRVDTATAAPIGAGRAGPRQARVRPRAHRPGHRRRLPHRPPGPVPTYIDPWLQRYDVVWAAAGHPAAVFSTTYDELVAMTGATDDRRGVTVEIWLNPACSKCRTAVSELDAAGVEYTVRRYLDDPPTAAELADVVSRLGLEPWDIARAKEAREAGIDLAREPAQRDAWLDALAAHPRALQRPIITAADGTTVVGRDADSLGRVIGAEPDSCT